VVYARQGEETQAPEYLLKCLCIHKSVHGENHPDVAVSYKNIGSIFEIQGEYMKALTFYLRLLRVYKSIHGENHLETIKFQKKINKIESMSQSEEHP